MKRKISDNTADRVSIYESVTNSIVAAIENGAGDWRMPWHNDANVMSVNPVSVSSGKRYRGMNTVILWAASQAKGYDSSVWGTFKAWKERGANVNKGQKATQVVFWKSLDVRATDLVTNETKTEKRLIARGYYVFNVAQVSGYEPKKQAEISAPLPLNARIDHAEKFYSAISAEVKHGGNSAFCSRATGHIQLPSFDQFNSAEDYYSTRGHETVHWSGHAPRLDRTFGKRFGDDDYAKEELVAELGAAFLCAHLELSNVPRIDHAQYIESWLKALKNDHRLIFAAASKAQAACDYLVNLAGDITDDADEETVSEMPAAEAPVAETPIPLPTIPDLVPAIVASPEAPIGQWSRNPDFVPCKRSLRTGRKQRWRTYYGYKPGDGFSYRPMNAAELGRQAAQYRAWLSRRDATREEMPLAAD
jgi:antirestriction protein ArdC